MSLIRALTGFGPCLQGGIEGEEMRLAILLEGPRVEEASAPPEVDEDHALKGSSSSLSTFAH